VAVLNTYCSFDAAGAKGRAASAELAQYLNAPAVKFNFGNEPDRAQEYIENLEAWRNELPVGCRLLCECHGGTILEEPETAAAVLAPVFRKVEFIVHAFSGDDSRRLERSLEALGTRVTHVHAWLGDRSIVPGRIEMLQEAGYSGTWTIEFCRGVDEPPEDMEELLATAAEDMRFLRRNLA
jgi:sugar phosphate isomerase/epimerase